MKKNNDGLPIHGNIDKAFVSIYDEFLFAFDETHPLTPSQMREKEKHRVIAEKRDRKDT